METTQLKIAIRELSRNRARTLLSLAAIGFGVVAILLAAGFVEWIFWAMRDDAIRPGSDMCKSRAQGSARRGLQIRQASCCRTM
ncbi:MAG: hypothetical protein IPO82_04295 [Betaproteobacteria bacterium]|nr:hypothetical protein [Betaproteobacteria bacterium]